MPDEHAQARGLVRRHLLLDSRVVEGSINARLVLGSVKKHEANPLFGEDRLWEKRFDNLYANVIYDEQERLYKVWYSPFIVDHSAKGMTRRQWREKKYQAPVDREMAICYATSNDGISWHKPDLGLVEYAGSTRNNILWRGREGSSALRAGPHGVGIFKDDREPEPTRRYKAILKSEILSVAFSRDGVHWDTPIDCTDVDSSGDTHNNAFWAPTLGKYVGITRQWGDKPFRRQVARTWSHDFVDWEDSQVVLEGLDGEHQTYAMPVFFYGGIYIGLLAVHDQVSDRVWTELTWSPDTSTWHRVCAGTPFIPNGITEGDYDWGCVFAAACPIIKKDEILIYFGGNDGLHTSWRNGYFCLVTLRLDGFAGYRADASDRQATVTTAPVFERTDELRVSADVENGGVLLVRVINDEMRVVAESHPIRIDVSDKKVRWRDDRLLSETKSEPTRLQFVLHRAIVYSFTLRSTQLE